MLVIFSTDNFCERRVSSWDFGGETVSPTEKFLILMTLGVI